MRPIRRAVVTGLFAIWFAPLSARYAKQSAGAATRARLESSPVNGSGVEPTPRSAVGREEMPRHPR